MIASAPGSAGHRLSARLADGPHVSAPSKPNSFMVAIKDRDRFKEAIRTKLVLEVAGGTRERRIVPVAEKSRGGPVSLVREYGRTAASGERRYHP